MDWFGGVLVEHAGLLGSGYGRTVALVALSFVASLAIGTVVAVFRLAPLPIVPGLARAEVEAFRNTPLLVQMGLFWLGLGSIGIRLTPFVAASIALSLYTGAFVTEAVRAGVATVGAGQREAAYSLGLTFVGSMRHIVLPQAFRAVIPPLGNLFIAMIKNSAIASAISVPELLYVSEVLNGRTFRTFEIFTGVLIGYLSLTIPTAALVRRLERRLEIKR
ncbi:MAG TPA: amino acid ABC transporter permease [Actinomycetota bacterium]|nr:amino acid ABC transporter permease [Actinomycetota bacterium]